MHKETLHKALYIDVLYKALHKTLYKALYKVLYKTLYEALYKALYTEALYYGFIYIYLLKRAVF